MTKTTTKIAAKPSYKEGQRVAHSLHGTGKIEAIVPAVNGTWLAVNFGDKKKPNVKRVRPATVSKA